MPTVVDDLRELDRRAVQIGADIVHQVRPEDLGRPTPCAHWSLADLLAHMTAQHRGFRAASLGRGGDLAVWAPDPAASDPVADYLAAARAVQDAFAGEGVLDRSFALPEISPDVAFGARQAIGFHFIDYVVHGWDVARALGRPYRLADELAPAALRIAAQVPDGERRLLPGAAFAPALAPEPERETAPGSPLERILRLLGRSPNWPGSEFAG